MRNLLLAVIILCAVPLSAAEERSILFIGNSLTIYNDLPKLVAGLAQAGGQGQLLTDRVLVGGADLEKHWKDGVALERIRARPWTWVVLQEQSTATYAKAEAFTSHARLFLAAIAGRGATPVLYLTWARRGELERQDLITAAYRTLAAESGALLVPAGEAFRAWRATRGEEALFRDNRHPTPLGSYLAACCFYGVLFGRDPAGLPGDAAGLDLATAARLQALAWAAR